MIASKSTHVECAMLSIGAFDSRVISIQARPSHATPRLMLGQPLRYGISMAISVKQRDEIPSANV